MLLVKRKNQMSGILMMVLTMTQIWEQAMKNTQLMEMEQRSRLEFKRKKKREEEKLEKNHRDFKQKKINY